MIYTGTHMPFRLNRDGNSYEAENGKLEAPAEYAEILAKYGFTPEKQKESKSKTEPKTQG